MDNPRPEKAAVVEEVRQHFGEADAAILTEYRGLKVKDLATLRRSLRSNGGEFKIYKNTLVRLAAKEAGYGDLEQLLVGPVAIAFIKGDAAGVAKALRDYSRVNPLLTVKGGVLGEKVIGPRETSALAELPSREVLLSQLAGTLAAPMQQFASLLQALPRNLAYGLAALRDKQGGSAEAPGESPGESPAPDDAAGEAPAAEEAAAAPAPAPDDAAGEAPAAEEAAAGDPSSETPTDSTPTAE
jgi:large subunit ribosomal protein L10